MIDYGKNTQKPIRTMTLLEAKQRIKEGHFGAGSMGPKIEAALGFVQNGGDYAIITSLDKAMDSLDGKTGTKILPG